MAYDQNTDYKAIIDALEKKKKASLSAAEQSAIQAEIDAATQSRTEKIASDLDKYGQYATSGDLDKVFTYQAGQSIGSQYEQAGDKLRDAYAASAQNINNDALSRGMARSSFVGDRLQRNDAEMNTGLSNLNENKATAIYDAKMGLKSAYDTNAANKLASDKAEYANTATQYYQDYQKEIDRVKGNNDQTDDWKADILGALRQQKIADTASAQAAAQQQTFENQLAAAKLYSGGSSSGGSGGSSYTQTAEQTYGGYTRDEIVKMVNNGMLSKEDGSAILANPDGATPTTPTTPTPTNGNVYPVSGLTAGGKQAYTLIGAPSADGRPTQYTQQQAEQMLAAYLSRGAITENDFLTLMSVFGLDPSKYMS